MNKEIYNYIGLTEKESEIYQALLKLGESPISDLVKETGDHSQIIYRAIDGLVGKGLAQITIKKHRKYVQAEDPRTLERIEERKLAEIKQSIPYLLKLQKRSRDAIVKVFKGKEAAKTARMNMLNELPDEGSYLVIGASGKDFYEIMGTEWHEMERSRIKKKIAKKMISYESQRALFEQYEKYGKYSEVKYLPFDYPVPSNTIIYGGNKMQFYIFASEPIVMLVESSEIAQSFTHFFDVLWAMGKA